MSSDYGQKYYNYYPTGALRTREEVLDLVIEARKEKKAIRIYTVNQGGHLDCFYIYSKTKLHKKGAPDPTPYPLKKGVLFDMLYPIVHDHRSISSSKTNKRWFKWHEYIGSYGIKDGSPYPTEHRMFTNKRAAEEYSTLLQNDREYQEGIVRWHKYCNKMFDAFDKLWED